MNALLQEGLLATKHIQHAAIIRRKDGIVKAKSNSFTVSPNEILVIENAFDNPNDVRGKDAILPFMNTAYKAVRADQYSIYGKHDKTGVIISRTQHHYIIGTYDSNMYASVAVESVEKLGICD
jgi:profilin